MLYNSSVITSCSMHSLCSAAAEPERRAALRHRAVQVILGVIRAQHPARHVPVVPARVRSKTRVEHRQLVCRGVRDARRLDAAGVVPVLNAGDVVVEALDHAAHAALDVEVAEPLLTAPLEVLEEVHPPVVVVGRHPVGVVRAVDARPPLQEGVVGVVVHRGHGLVVRELVLVLGPEVAAVARRLVGAAADALEVPVAALLAGGVEVMLLVPVDSHPGGVVNAEAAAVLVELGEVVGNRAAGRESLVLGLGIHRAAGIGATCALI
mmetsp:Transcript_2766/g.6308  ORF Transcript_2766/g.6308 Transcript_2766/m.6308 type:complete len:265 (+) Transcript_2766:263-1057(+)